MLPIEAVFVCACAGVQGVTFKQMQVLFFLHKMTFTYEMYERTFCLLAYWSIEAFIEFEGSFRGTQPKKIGGWKKDHSKCDI